MVDLIPGVDWLFQKLIIIKNYAKKVGKIYGIYIRFLDEKDDNKYK